MIWFKKTLNKAITILTLKNERTNEIALDFMCRVWRQISDPKQPYISDDDDMDCYLLEKAIYYYMNTENLMLIRLKSLWMGVVILLNLKFFIKAIKESRQ